MVQQTDRLAQLLHDAIVIAEHSRERDLLRHLHEARLALQDWSATTVAIRVDLLCGRVFARGVPVAMTRAELAVIFALAIEPRGMSPEQLADNLYPDVDVVSGTNSLKVNVHRVRRRIGVPGVVHFAGGRYSLGEMVDVDLRALETELSRLRTDPAIARTSRDRLERIRRRLAGGRAPFMLEWAWFESTEHRLSDLERNVTVLLARNALWQDELQRALDLAIELSQSDPLDEDAAEIAIRAFLRLGDRAAAVLAYRRYASVVQRELDAAPPEQLLALING